MREITKTVLKFLFGFALVLAASAFLAPWLHGFLPFKFDRILRRCIMIGTLILVAWLVRERRGSLDRLGLGWREGSLRLFGTGFFSGFLLVMVLTLVQWGLGAREWRLHETDLWHWIGLFFKGMGAGLLIGAIEEFFFRGFLFLLFKDLWNTKGSLIMTNVIYAGVHFFPKGRIPPGVEPTASDSFQILSSMIPSILGQPELLLAATGLFLFGLILSFAFLQAGSLFLPIGIHSGAVFGLKMNRRFLTDVSGKMDLWTGSKNLYDGWAGLMVLAVVALIGGLISRSRSRLAVILLLGLILFPPSLQAVQKGHRSKETSEPPEQIVYSFTEHISSAQAVRKQGRQIYEGAWVGGRFRFAGLPDSAEIFMSDRVVVEKTTRPGIQLKTLPKQESSLIFSKVPPAKRLRIFFALADAHFEKNQEVSPAQFEVWIGSKRLFETRINDKGWHDRTIDLTLPYILQRNYRFLFRVRIPGESSQQFVFYGYLE